jgi:hypothetical protein
MEIRANLDFETPPCSRANGMFQVIELKDNQGNDLTNLATLGHVYTSIEELRQQLDMALKMPIPRVEVIEED